MEPPATVATSTPTGPMADASTTRPLRKRYIQKLTNSAIGIVQAMVKVPQELPGMTCTQPSPNVTFPSCDVGSAESGGHKGKVRTYVFRIRKDSGRSAAGPSF